jgi:hypothetical protein
VSSEHYGYVAGQALTHAQGAAVVDAMTFWGGAACSELPFPVCKTSHKPWDPATGAKMYGCVRHSGERKRRIDAAGGHLRPGWASFDQWGDAPPPPPPPKATPGGGGEAEHSGAAAARAAAAAAAVDVSAAAAAVDAA